MFPRPPPLVEEFPRPLVGVLKAFPRPTPRSLLGVRGGTSEGPAADVPCEYLQLLPNLQFPFAKSKQGLWL